MNGRDVYCHFDETFIVDMNLLYYAQLYKIDEIILWFFSFWV